jgi:outer membrane protein assembly factor BamB
LFLLPLLALAQPIQFGFDSPPPPELTAPQVDVVSGPTAARLEQAAALVENKNWPEAIDTYRELSTDPQRMVELDDGRYVSIRSYCQLQLANLPPEGLAAYRRSVDPLAERWFREAVPERDEQKLRRIVDEMYGSSWADDALLALGEIALERADFAAARRWWEQISPLLRSPRGLPLWLALRDIDVDENWPEIEKRWNERSNSVEWQAYPDTSLDLADVRARLIVVSIRAGEFDRAATELAAFRRQHPTASGRLGGKTGPYVAALDRLLSTSREWKAEPGNSGWPTFAGSQTRCSDAPPIGPITGAAWSAPITIPKMIRAPFIRSELELDARAALGEGQNSAQQISVRESDHPLSCFPIVVDNLVAFNDGRQIRALDLATGRPAVTKDGILYREGMIENPANAARVNPTTRVRSFAAYGVARCTLTAVNDIIYSRAGRFPTVWRGSDNSLYGVRLVGVDVSRDGLLAFQTKVTESVWSFDGAPISDGRRLWVAMRRRDVLPHAYVACYDTASNVELWRTAIGAADTPAAGAGHEITHNLLTLVDDRIYLNTNVGLVAALDSDTGEVCWLHRYERVKSTVADGLASPLHFDRDPSPCMYRDGLVIVAPADTPAVFALDAHTGMRVWTNDQLANVLHLLGVVKQNLVVSGNQLRVLDIRSGEQRFVWPETEHSGIRGVGRGVVAGEEIFWPTRDAIYAIHALTGERTRAPFKPPGIEYQGANLAAARDRLIVATHDKLTALGPKYDN